MVDESTFEPLLMLRRRDESDRRRSFDIAAAGVSEIRRRIAALRNRLSARNRLAETALFGGAAARMAEYRKAVSSLLADMRTAESSLAVAEKDADEKREAMIEAMKRRKAIESAMAKVRRRRATELGRRSVKDMDDLYAAGTAAAKG